MIFINTRNNLSKSFRGTQITKIKKSSRHSPELPGLHNRIIYLPRKLGGTAFHSFRSLAEGVVLMYVTYDNLFTFVLMIVAIITLVKSFNDRHKK